MDKKKTIWAYSLIFIVVLLFATPAIAATTTVHIVRYANDGTTVLNQTNVDYQWMMDNLPVLGDGVTHYYHQGPVFIDDDNETLEQELRWNPEEDTNVQEKDMGVVKGTNLKDLCDLVGGMAPGERVKVISSDGFNKWFGYQNVYNYSSREGPIGLTWYMNGNYPDTGYSDGMKLVWFADDSVNPWGIHAFGNFDWHEAAAPEYWYYYQQGSEKYPTTTGLSSKYVNRIYIYSNEVPSLAPVAAFTADPLSGTAPLTVQFIDQSTGDDITSWAWDVDNDGTVDYTTQNATHTFMAAGTYTVNLTVTNNEGSDYEVKVDYITVTSTPSIDEVFNGTVALTEGETFTVSAYNTGGGTYTVNRTTPLGALDVAATTAGFTYDVTDKNFATSGSLLLDNIGSYLYQKTPRKAWYGYVNDVYKDGYNNPAGALNLIPLNDGDRVEFYFVEGTVDDPTDYAAVTAAASAAVMMVASTGETPTDWSISLYGEKTMTVDKAYFEQGLACPSAGHMVSYTDADGNVWAGVPLWLLVAMVDDNPDEGPDHFNFNDALAAEGYSVKVTAGDGYSINFESTDIARSNDYIVANTLNGEPLPLYKPNSTKLCFPLQMIGPAVSSGKLVGNIKSIELVGLPEPPAGWTLRMEGDVVDIITQQYFEEGIACSHNITYTDDNGNVWSGVALWELVGAVDDIESSSHWTFSDTLASTGYTIRVIAADGFSRTFASGDVARSSNYIVANKKNGEPLDETDAPLRLVGADATGGNSVGKISTIRLEGLPAYPPGNWSLLLNGAISDTIPQYEFEDWASCHSATYDDGAGNVYTGIPLWRLMGWVDDRIPHGSNGFNNALANAGYKVILTAGDGYSKELTSQQIGTTNGFIIANTLNGQPLPTDGDHPPYPLRLVGAGLPSASYSVGNLASISLTDFQEPTEIPTITIIKYASDEVTIINQTTVDHVWMEAYLPVIGDGVTRYQYQGLTLDPDDLWDPTETKGMNPPKIDNAIKGTKVRDLCNLVGGMDPGTEVTFVAVDNWETTLPYDCIYPNPHVYSHLGDTIIAWYADGQYVPKYGDGPRLFFAPEDHVVGQWNMHEAIPEEYWHYNYQGGVNYPSVAGLSAKYIATIKIYASPVTDWTLVLEGDEIGGLKQNISRSFFESALSCQFGANHEAEYTDSQGRTWAGMPLWLLAGYVDDQDQHSVNAFNDTLAAAGYDVIVTAGDGTSTTIPSDQIIRNNNYLVANKLNGTRINETDSSWPLRLVGQNVTGAMSVKGVASIELVPSLSLKVESPNGGETWILGSAQSVQWIYTGNPGSSVKIEALKGERVIATIPSVPIGSGGSGSFNLTVPSRTPLGDDYRFRVTSTSNPAYTDVSDAPFTIASPIVVVSPDGGEVWQLGSAQSVQWSYTSNPGSTVKIEALRGETVIATVSNVPIGSGGTGFFNLTVPFRTPLGDNYRFRVSSTSNPAYTDTSNAPFTISADTGSSITIVSPDGGEIWTLGSAQSVQWTYTGNPGSTVKIEALRGETVIATVSSVSIGSGGIGFFNLTVPFRTPLGDNYRFRVTSTSNPAYTDTSNAPFTISDYVE